MKWHSCSTFPTSQEWSILDSRTYCNICLQSSHVMLACLFIKNPPELALVRTEGDKRMIVSKSNSRVRTLNPRADRKCYRRFEQYNRNLPTTFTQQWRKNRGIKTSPPLSPAASKPVTLSKKETAKVQGQPLPFLKAVPHLLTICRILSVRQMPHLRMSLQSKPSHPSIFAMIIRHIPLPTRLTWKCWQTTMKSSIYLKIDTMGLILASVCITPSYPKSFERSIPALGPNLVHRSLLRPTWRKHIPPAVKLSLNSAPNLPINIEDTVRRVVLLGDLHAYISFGDVYSFVFQMLLVSLYINQLITGIFTI